MSPRKAVPILAAVIILAVAACILWPEHEQPAPEQPEPPPPTLEADHLPEWISSDQDTLSLVADHAVLWKVTDLNHAAYDGGERYRGFTERGETLTLSSGYYHVEAEGWESDILVRGQSDRNVEWEYDADGTSYRVSVSFSIDHESLAEAHDVAEALNSGPLRFDDLTSLVHVDGTIESIVVQLASEFERIGGSIDDRQAFADFIASFVQVTVDYPQSVPGHVGEFDYSLYGKAEYWAMPLQTLYLGVGDCEDTSALLCSLYLAAGYDTAMGGYSGHVFAGVALDGFTEVPEDRLEHLDPYRRYSVASETVQTEGGEITFYAVETIYSQLPVGYLTSGDTWFGTNTPWGVAGFYPVSR